MAKRPKKRMNLDELLSSLSEALFPEGDGSLPVSMTSVSKHGDGPLHIAVELSNQFGVRLLVDAGANINAIGSRGESPLHKAVGEFDGEMIKLLLSLGADQSLQSDTGETAEQFSARYAKELLRYFRQTVDR